MMELVLADNAQATALRALSLRYFNPIGADPMLRTGLQIRRPTHLLGKLITAREEDAEFLITGVDWPTRDGSGIRDYIHVWDLARAHVAALRRFDDILPRGGAQSHLPINLGTGSGTTVREFVEAFQVAAGPLRVRDAGPRPGDSAGSYTRSERSGNLLHWQPELTVTDGIRHSLQWSSIRNVVLASSDGLGAGNLIQAGPVTAGPV